MSAHPNPAATKGRFLPGNPGGPGNPFARRTAAIRQVFYNAVSDEELHAYARKLYTDAIQGDHVAGKLFLSYMLGKPPQPTNPDTLDAEEVRQHQQAPTMSEVRQVCDHRVPAKVAVRLLRAAVAEHETVAAAMGLEERNSSPQRHREYREDPAPSPNGGKNERKRDTNDIKDHKKPQPPGR